MGRCCFYTAGTLSLLLLVTSVTLLVARVFQKAVDQTIEKNMVLQNGTKVFNSWEKPPLPVYIQFYFFNVTNPEEILQGEIPLLEEVGPYTYRELRNKANIQFGENGTTISAVTNKAYVFERNQSVGDPNVDLIRTINIPLLTVVDLAQLTLLRELIEAMLKAYQQKLFVIHTVHELLWGYKDEILSLVHIFKPDVSPNFGLFYERNGTNDGEYVFLTGEDNYLNFSKIVEWNGKTSLDWWTTDTCNMINGTDGDSFHPLISKDEVLYLFPSDLCRSVHITFSSFENVEGLPAFRYKVPAEILANTSENAGFCIPEGNCMDSGVLNISICKNGAPIIMSFPHFYQADEKFVSAIKGMHPNKEEHESFVDINPLTGIILRGAKRFQINTYVRKLDDFVETGDIRTMVFPVMYLNESVLIDKETANQLKSVINTTLVVTNIPYIIMALGVFFGLVFTWLACRGQGSMDEGTADERAPPYPDHTQFEKSNPHYDPSSKEDDPKWSMVDVQFVRMMKRFIPLEELKTYHQAHKATGGPLKSMTLFTRQRLSVQPLTQGET